MTITYAPENVYVSSFYESHLAFPLTYIFIFRNPWSWIDWSKTDSTLCFSFQVLYSSVRQLITHKH